MPPLKLYGVPLSQPFRSVAWTLLQCKAKFEIKLTVPGATTSIGSLNEAYLSKTRYRTGRIPLLEDGNFTLAESPAILSYLCENKGWGELYGPPGSEKKANIDCYMHWHHHGTRNLARLSFPYFRPESKTTLTDRDWKKVEEALDSLENGWLAGENYIAGGNEHSIADMLAYEEVIGVSETGLLKDLDKYPKIKSWMDKMRKLPFHKEAHVALETLGDITVPSDVPLMKHLGAATKAGIQAFMHAQESYDATQSKL